MSDQQPPTSEDVVKAGKVGQAAATAASEAATAEEARTSARTAVKSKAEEVNLKLSDEDVSRIVDGMVDALDARGAFEPPPAPPPPAAPPETDAPALPAAAAPVETPRKKSLAERFAGL